MEKIITYVGLDVHKDTISVASAEAALREKYENTARYRIRLQR